MSYQACMSNVKNPDDRNKHKGCVCGGHNHNNSKRCKHHNGTMARLSIKSNRRFIYNLKRGVIL